jgi:hypothetical protein
MASFRVSESTESETYCDSSSDSDSDSDSDADSYISFPSLDDHPELFTEEKSWVEFHTNKTQKYSEEQEIEKPWEKGWLGDKSDILHSKITKGDQILALEESRVWNNYFSRDDFC